MDPALAVARRPLDTAAMIPQAAAGRQPLFFFGTLMDLDVLAYLLERPVDVASLVPATLAGFRRVRVRGASYPTLLPMPHGSLEGRLLTRVTRRDIARINHYESEEYGAQLHAVRTMAGEPVAAWLFIGLESLVASDEPWALEDWQETAKPAFFARCDHWMSDFPEGR
jgi:hypothetical protein